jgi:hypothetical protein
MRRHALWLSTLVCAASLLALPATRAEAQGNGGGQGHGNADHQHGKGKDKNNNKDKDKDKDEDKDAEKDRAKESDKAKAAKRANPEAAKDAEERTRFRGLDRNNDGRVSRAEWNGNDASFANHDWNHDGVLSGTEMDPGAARSGPSAAVPAEPRATSRAPVPAPKPRGESDEVLFARRDTNHDRRISRAEWTLDAKTFERLDTNRDGWLSPYEFGVGR